MTEEEAKRKWCPHVRVATDEDAATNRWSNDPFGGNTNICIASACMAWRWNEAKRTDAFAEAVREHMRTQAKPNAATATQEVYAARGHKFANTEGFCGLAGALAGGFK